MLQDEADATHTVVDIIFPSPHGGGEKYKYLLFVHRTLKRAGKSGYDPPFLFLPTRNGFFIEEETFRMTIVRKDDFRKIGKLI
jgi:hypothetical protein